MNEQELLRLKRLLEELYGLCQKGHYGLAMKKITLGILPMVWDKIEEKLRPQTPASTQ